MYSPFWGLKVTDIFWKNIYENETIDDLQSLSKNILSNMQWFS